LAVLRDGVRTLTHSVEWPHVRGGAILGPGTVLWDAGAPPPVRCMVRYFYPPTKCTYVV